MKVTMIVTIVTVDDTTKSVTNLNEVIDRIIELRNEIVEESNVSIVIDTIDEE